MKAIIWCEDTEKSVKEHTYLPKQVCYATVTDDFEVGSVYIKKLKADAATDKLDFDLMVNKYYAFLADKIKDDGITDIYIRHDMDAAFIKIPFYYAEKDSDEHYEYNIHVLTTKAIHTVGLKLAASRKNSKSTIDEKFMHNKTELTFAMGEFAKQLEQNAFRDLNKSYYGALSAMNESIDLDTIFATRIGGKVFHTRTCESFYKFIKSGKSQYELFGVWDLEDKRPCAGCIKGGKFKTIKSREFDFTALEEKYKAEQEEKDAEAKKLQAEREAEKARIKEERRLKNEEKRLANEKAKAERERIAAEKAEQERIAKEKAAEEERLRLEAEKKAEEERLAAEKAEQERLEAERIAQEKAEQERLEAERLAKEKAEAEKAEQERLAKEQAEAERLAKEQEEKERELKELEAKKKAERLKKVTEKTAKISTTAVKEVDETEEVEDSQETAPTETVEVETSVDVKYKGIDPLGVALIKICSKYGMYCELHKGGEIGIKTASGSWSFNYLTRPITLMHMNYDYKSNSAKFKQYHAQNNKFESPLDVIEYIIKHDNDRINRLIGEYDL